VIEEQ
jgi:hypothetical protein